MSEPSWQEIAERLERLPDTIVKWAHSERNPVVDRAIAMPEKPQKPRGTIPNRDLRLPPLPTPEPIKSSRGWSNVAIMLAMFLPLPIVGLAVGGWIGACVGFGATLQIIAEIGRLFDRDRKTVWVNGYWRRPPRR